MRSRLYSVYIENLQIPGRSKLGWLRRSGLENVGVDPAAAHPGTCSVPPTGAYDLRFKMDDERKDHHLKTLVGHVQGPINDSMC